MNSLTRAENFTLSVAYAAGYSGLVALPLWLGAVIDRFRIEDWIGGLLASIYLFSVFVCTVILSTVIERFDRKRLVLLGLALGAIGFMIVALSPGVPTVIAGLVTAGSGFGLCLGVASGAALLVPDPQRAFASFSLALSIFVVVFYLVAPPVFSAFGFAALFMVLVVMAVVAAMLVWKYFPQLPRGKLRAGDSAEGPSRGRQMPQAYVTLAAIGVYFVANAGIWSFVERIGRTRDLDTASIGLVLSFASFVSMGAALLAARLGSRIGRLPAILASLTALATISMSLVTFTTRFSYALGAVLFLSFAIFLLPYALSFLESVDVTGRASVASGGVIMMGNSIGPLVGGAIVSAAGLETLGCSVVVGFAVAGSLFLLARRAAQGPV